MPIYQYGHKIPKIGKDSYISETAIIIGGVVIGDNCYIGHGSILRGDYGNIVIGDGTAVEENVMIHIRPNDTIFIGKEVTIGHSATIHCKEIKNYAVVGLGSIISFDVVIGEWTIIGEGCVIPNSKIIPSNKIVVGNPYKIISDVTSFHKKRWSYVKELYKTLAKEYHVKLKKIK